MKTQPNILLIVADDLGYGDIGAFNAGRTQTPSLDRLVAEGLCLAQHYSASPVCAPARAALLTGRYAHRTGAIDTLDFRGLDRIALRERTLGDAFKRAGYATGLIGKWHNGALDPRFHPNARGFTEFTGFRGGWQDYYRWNLDVNGVARATDGRYVTDVFSDEAVSFIQRHARRPFFLNLAYNAPHFPFQAPEEDLKPFENLGLTKGVHAIYAMVRRMDRGIQRVLDELKAQGLDENTLVLFTSDNGPQMYGSGEMNTDRFNCNLRGAKGLTYEGGIRVPMIVRWPARIKGGTSSDEIVHFTDWWPTLMAAAGVELAPELPLDGVNILPILCGERGKTNPRRFWQWNRYTPVCAWNAAMRDGPWKLVRPSTPEAQHLDRLDCEMDHDSRYHPERMTQIFTGPEPARTIPPPPPPQLFNLVEDPFEKNDLAARETARVKRMESELEAWFADVDGERRKFAVV